MEANVPVNRSDVMNPTPAREAEKTNECANDNREEISPSSECRR